MRISLHRLVHQLRFWLLLAFLAHLFVLLIFNFDAKKPVDNQTVLDVTLIDESGQPKNTYALVKANKNTKSQVKDRASKPFDEAKKQTSSKAISGDSPLNPSNSLMLVSESAAHNKMNPKAFAGSERLRKRTISASTFEARDAIYLDSWRQRVERIGNLHYPAKARTQKLYGQLRLLVAINADGSLNEVEVLRSSGNDVLDNAAKDIVQLAAPFEPLPFDITKDTDVLEIVRTWQFLPGNRFSQ